MILLDWENAFDRITHQALFAALEGFGIPDETISLIKQLYKNPTFFVEIEGEASDIAKQENGIRQGCPLSP